MAAVAVGEGWLPSSSRPSPPSHCWPGPAFPSSAGPGHSTGDGREDEPRLWMRKVGRAEWEELFFGGGRGGVGSKGAVRACPSDRAGQVGTAQ